MLSSPTTHEEGTLPRAPACLSALGLTSRSFSLPLNLIAAIIIASYSIDPSIRSICTRCCFTKTNMIQVRSNFY